MKLINAVRLLPLVAVSHLSACKPAPSTREVQAKTIQEAITWSEWKCGSSDQFLVSFDEKSMTTINTSTQEKKSAKYLLRLLAEGSTTVVFDLDDPGPFNFIVGTEMQVIGGTFGVTSSGRHRALIVEAHGSQVMCESVKTLPLGA